MFKALQKSIKLSVEMMILARDSHFCNDNPLPTGTTLHESHKAVQNYLIYDIFIDDNLPAVVTTAMVVTSTNTMFS